MTYLQQNDASILISKKHPLLTWMREECTANDIGIPATMDQLSSKNECSICLETMKELDSVLCLQDCCHLFHTHCIMSWTRQCKSCPLCRKVTTQPDVQLRASSKAGYVVMDKAEFHRWYLKSTEKLIETLQKIPIRFDPSIEYSIKLSFSKTDN